MVKKASLILLCFFYFVVSSGFNISFHYCAGKFKGISLIQDKEDGCCGSKKKSKGCCKEKYIVYRIKDNYPSSNKALIPNTPVKHLLTAFVITNLNVPNPSIDLFAVPDFHAPPELQLHPVYLLNRNFRV